MSNSVADEKPQHAKRLKLLSKESPSPCSLPIEIALICLARVSKLDHASWSLVSKWHRRQLISPELYELRSRLGCTENIIYLCLVIPPEPNPRWFALFPKALDRPRRLVQVRSTLYQPPEVSSVVAHGFGIYVIGGRRIRGRHCPSSSVYFLDCRSHTWTTLPFMGVPRESAAAGVIDGKMYVLGGSKGDPNPGEVFDPKTQTWDALPVPEPENLSQYNLMYESGVVEDKIFAENEFGTAFFYTRGTWKIGNKNIARDKRGWHAIDKVMYCCVSGGRILWCEASELETEEVTEWREVMGLEALRDTLSASQLVSYAGCMSDHWYSYKGATMSDQSDSYRWHAVAQGAPTQEEEELAHVFPGHKLSNSGPNMLLFWDVLAPHQLDIWCAEISLERRKESGQIWGNIVWSEAVMTRDPPPPHHLHCKLLYSVSLNL